RRHASAFRSGDSTGRSGSLGPSPTSRDPGVSRPDTCPKRSPIGCGPFLTIRAGLTGLRPVHRMPERSDRKIFTRRGATGRRLRGVWPQPCPGRAGRERRMSRYSTIIFVPHARARFRKLTVSTRLLAAAAAGLGALLVAAVVFAWAYVSTARQDRRYQDTAAENARLKSSERLL